jgi:hypothetical protein
LRRIDRAPPNWSRACAGAEYIRTDRVLELESDGGHIEAVDCALPGTPDREKFSGDFSLSCWSGGKVRRSMAEARGRQVGLVVSSPKELREYADECIGWARSARTDNERDIFLQMARTWIEAATRLERTLGIVDEHRENAKPAK